MTWGLAGAVAAAVLYGVTTVLQVVAVRRQPLAVGLDVRLLRGLAASPLYVFAMAMEFVGFLLSLAALRSLPLFVVQAVLCGNFAVAALIARVVLRVRLGSLEWLGVALVSIGIAMLAMSAKDHDTATLTTTGRLALVVTAVALAVAAGAAARWRTPYAPALLGLLAGLSFGLADISARVLRDPASPATMLADPATLSLACAGILGLWLNATALQRASVTVVVAADVVAYTVVPALVGVLALGDAPRAGWEPVALTGFLLAVGGAVTLARHGAPETRVAADQVITLADEERVRAPSPAPRTSPAPGRSAH